MIVKMMTIGVLNITTVITICDGGVLWGLPKPKTNEYCR